MINKKDAQILSGIKFKASNIEGHPATVLQKGSMTKTGAARKSTMYFPGFIPASGFVKAQQSVYKISVDKIRQNLPYHVKLLGARLVRHIDITEEQYAVLQKYSLRELRSFEAVEVPAEKPAAKSGK